MDAILNPVSGIDKALAYIIGFSFILWIAITIAMVYFLWRYHEKRNPQAADIRGNLKLEIIWMVIPLIIVLSMFYYGWESYMGLRNVPPDALNIDVKARMFDWEFDYPSGKQSQNVMVVPEGKAVRLNIESEDVIHSISIPAFRIKVDAVPGLPTYAWFQADKPGEYTVFCTEYCGVGHSDMTATLKIVPYEEYKEWLARVEEPAPAAETVAVDSAEPPVDITEFKEVEGPVNFAWMVDGENLHVKISAETTGWVAVGFNPESAMRGANFILGAVNNQSQVLVTDHYGVGYTKHKEDTSIGGTSDVSQVYGSEKDGVTEIGFTIPLDSGDMMDTPIDPAKLTTVLLAYSAAQDSFITRHRNRYKMVVNLTTGEVRK